MVRGHSVIAPVPAHQADATLNQAAPDTVTPAWYTILDTTRNVRIISIVAACTWTVQPDPLEVRITIDGETLTGSQANPVSATAYRIWIDENSALPQLATTSRPERAFLLEGRSVKVEARITGGTVSNLSGRVKYAKW